VQVGATPVFADVCAQDWCIDPVSFREKITSRTRAVIPVHLYSQMVEMDEILAIARRHGIAVVEDCAHAHGSRWGTAALAPGSDRPTVFSKARR
jgi:dTDP-4-amino-4,6-dideoxygalactose transaminase